MLSVAAMEDEVGGLDGGAGEVKGASVEVAGWGGGDICWLHRLETCATAIRVGDAWGVDVSEGQAVEFEGDADVVAGGAREVGDDRDVALGEGVDEGALADVGPSPGGDERWREESAEDGVAWGFGGRGFARDFGAAPAIGLIEQQIDGARAGGAGEGLEHPAFDLVGGFGEGCGRVGEFERAEGEEFGAEFIQNRAAAVGHEVEAGGGPAGEESAIDVPEIAELDACDGERLELRRGEPVVEGVGLDFDDGDGGGASGGLELEGRVRDWGDELGSARHGSGSSAVESSSSLESCIAARQHSRMPRRVSSGTMCSTISSFSKRARALPPVAMTMGYPP